MGFYLKVYTHKDLKTVDEWFSTTYRRNTRSSSSDNKCASDFILGQLDFNAMISGVHLIIANFSLGMGTLGIPYAISIGGYMAVPCIILTGFITNYTGKLIIDAQYDDSKGDDEERQMKTSEEQTDEEIKGPKTRVGYAAVGMAINFKTYICRVLLKETQKGTLEARNLLSYFYKSLMPMFSA